MYKLLFDKYKTPKVFIQIIASTMLMLFGTIVFGILIAEVFVAILGIQTVEELNNYAFISPIITIVSYALVCRLLVTMFSRANRTNAKAMGLYFDKNSRKKALLGFFMAAIAIAIYLVVSYGLGTVSISKGESNMLMLLFIAGELVTVFGEELLFRGYIQRLLMTRYSIEYSIIVSMLIVAGYTFTFSWNGLLPAIALMIKTLLLSLLLYKSGSIVMPYCFHAGINLVSRYFLGINSVTNSLLRIGTDNNIFFGSSEAGFESGIVMMIIYTILCLIVIFKYPKVDNEAQEFKDIKAKYSNNKKGK